MDKSTLSTYGWIIIVVIILCVILSLATPFGKAFIRNIFGVTDELDSTTSLSQIIEDNKLSNKNDGGDDDVYIYKQEKGENKIIYQWQEYKIVKKTNEKLTLECSYDSYDEDSDSYVRYYIMNSNNIMDKVKSAYDFNIFSDKAYCYIDGTKYCFFNDDNKLFLMIYKTPDYCFTQSVNYENNNCLAITCKDRDSLVRLPNKLTFNLKYSEYLPAKSDSLVKTRLVNSQQLDKYPKDGLQENKYYKFIGAIGYGVQF